MQLSNLKIVTSFTLIVASAVLLAVGAPSEPTSGSAPDAESEKAQQAQVHESNLTPTHDGGGGGAGRERKSTIDYYKYRHVVAEGVQRALDECRQKFKWDRWNCPKKAFLSILDRDEYATGASTLPSNKELGLTRALIASGIVLSMIRSCSYGTNSMCGCSNKQTFPIHHAQAASFLSQTGHHQLLQQSGAASAADQTALMSHVGGDQQQNLTPATGQPLVSHHFYIQTVEKPKLHQQHHSHQVDGGSSAENLSDLAAFAWAGCDEIVKFGFKVAKIYLDSQDSGSPADASRLINAHNYEAGRQAVKRTMKRRCKCHGLSGACGVNTCWTIVPSMSEVGEYLKSQYRVAAKVGASSAHETDVGSLSRELAAISSEKLVFADASPDYCYENKQLGINGTLGRYCSGGAKYRAAGEVSRSERDSCDRLCTKCGYKIKKEKITVEKQCDCRFVYCCSVECKRCPYVEETFKCVRHS